jgi:hypothetical protein
VTVVARIGTVGNAAVDWINPRSSSQAVCASIALCASQRMPLIRDSVAPRLCCKHHSQQRSLASFLLIDFFNDLIAPCTGCGSPATITNFTALQRTCLWIIRIATV